MDLNLQALWNILNNAKHNYQQYRNFFLYFNKPDYQCKEYDGVKDKGPLPEGKWLVRQSQHQNFYKDQSKFDQFRS